MNVLLVDLGNSRIKWARLRRGRLGRQYALPLQELSEGRLRRALFPDSRGLPAAVLAVSVAPVAVRRLFTQVVSGVSGITPRFIESARARGRLRNGYADAWRLGADRWVALVGAHAMQEGRAVVVVDVGTAMTLDFLAASGRHLGGAIVPGPELMIQSLLLRTGGIGRRAAPAGRAASPAAVPRRARRAPRKLAVRSTRAGLLAGAAHAAAAVVERAVAQATRARVQPLLLLTGGAAALVSPFVQAPHVVVPDLVLRGLASLASDMGAGPARS
jgi:type III pantothenate kinase